MRLIELMEMVETNDVTLERIKPDLDIVGLSADSRAVLPGYLFAALPGAAADGRAYIPQALDNGAVAILAPSGFRLQDWTGDAVRDDISVITDPDPRRRLARMAARFHGAQPDTIAAVTGTNGKTSVTSFTRQLWSALGYRSASAGTLGLVAPDMAGGETEPSLTTPDPVRLHETLAALKVGGVDHLALEASSHGLDQRRLDGVDITAAAFTNLTRDHLDYHRSMTAYRNAKLRLFDTLLKPGGVAVAPGAAPELRAIATLAAERGFRVLTYGQNHNGETPLHVGYHAATPNGDGWTLSLEVMGQHHDVEFALPGAFQIDNALCALALAIGCGADPATATRMLSKLTGVSGRLEKVGARANSAPVYVDYAHTPDALATVLRALRPHVPGRLTVVFGCGGDRDAGKRPEMGAVAARLADRVIVTDDNPRTEDPASIRTAILDECVGASEIGDRAEAIRTAIDNLDAGDGLLIAGKGHETGQIVGGETLPFNDADVARAAMAAADSQTGGQS
ncbi:MAG: UDP-N-acetylmuramoyl-L-alanyl-D-glutamate--2,6-diaminopimelate ligase [Rhodospirillaceae bacterium]|nr:UDP-N-acetylmuramoyl-L-alanyl-D-glutamate--2,6-diaminopimelate ligase [Rhodospirillaceae bacterium]MBT5664040.1 UDP-N-acetylmuramoyl-L-alanyl-D-glutamate--2,6-diaminopimelate ligase [Rhodospirillaceae bacterium]